jgi:hypothetical protein
MIAKYKEVGSRQNYRVSDGMNTMSKQDIFEDETGPTVLPGLDDTDNTSNQ